MGIFDCLIVLIIILGIYMGYQHGIVKQLADLVILFVSSFVATTLSKILGDALYGILPFFNFTGKAQGLKSINIVLWRLLIYAFLIMIIIAIIKKVMTLTKISEKVSDTMVESNFISRILGAVCAVPLMILLMFNVLMVLLLPNVNLTFVNNSKFSTMILEKMPVLSKKTSSIYGSEKQIIERINEEDNTKENLEQVNEDIIQILLDSNAVSDDKLEKLREDNRLLGTRSEKEDSKGGDDSEPNQGEPTPSNTGSSKPGDDYDSDGGIPDSDSDSNIDADDNSDFDDGDEDEGDEEEDDYEDEEEEEEEF